jgi:predicted transposase/invertase (TIGR01784 family)
VFLPKPDSPDQTIIFVEVQFQKDQGLYERLFSEIMMYLAQNPEIEDWRAIAVYPRRSIEQENRYRHRSLLQSEQFRVVYLEDFLGIPSEQIGVQLMQLIVSKEMDTAQYLQGMVQRLQGQTDPPNQAIIELISTVMVYKFPQLSREEIESMFTVSDLKQTKVYHEAQIEEAQVLILRQLNRRVGAIALETSARIRSLPLEQVEALGEALLDFCDRADLEQWLKENQ